MYIIILRRYERQHKISVLPNYIYLCSLRHNLCVLCCSVVVVVLRETIYEPYVLCLHFFLFEHIFNVFKQ